jgi:hypothetical protein
MVNLAYKYKKVTKIVCPQTWQVLNTGIGKKRKSAKQKHSNLSRFFSDLGHPDHVDLTRRQVCGPAEPERGTQLPPPPLWASPQTMKFFSSFSHNVYKAKLFLYVEDFRTNFHLVGILFSLCHILATAHWIANTTVYVKFNRSSL